MKKSHDDEQENINEKCEAIDKSRESDPVVLNEIRLSARWRLYNLMIIRVSVLFKGRFAQLFNVVFS